MKGYGVKLGLDNDTKIIVVTGKKKAVFTTLEHLVDEVFDSCCSVVKQVQAGIPLEEVKDNFIKFMKGQ